MPEFLFNARPSRAILISLMLLSLLGVMDAGYLTATHFLNIRTICLTFSQCDQVLDSQYAKVFGIPLALLGLLYYLAIFGLAVAFERTKVSEYWVGLMCIISSGFVFSLYLLYLQLFVIHAICQYCFISAAITTLLFLGVTFETFQSYLRGAEEEKTSTE